MDRMGRLMTYGLRAFSAKSMSVPGELLFRKLTYRIHESSKPSRLLVWTDFVCWPGERVIRVLTISVNSQMVLITNTWRHYSLQDVP